jgi:hypothetical protein
LDIAALAMVVAYLLLDFAITIGVLLVLLWLFAELPSTTEKSGCEQVSGLPSAISLRAEGTPSLSVEPERWEDEAA